MVKYSCKKEREKAKKFKKIKKTFKKCLTNPKRYVII